VNYDFILFYYYLLLASVGMEMWNQVLYAKSETTWASPVSSEEDRKIRVTSSGV